MTPPSLAELTTRFLTAKAVAPDFDELPEVVPHEVITSFRADSATTWVDAKAAFHLLGTTVPSLPMPKEWASFVSQLGDATVMPLCLGAVPQRMRELKAIRPDPTANRQSISSFDVPGMNSWIDARIKSGTPVDLLIVSSICRAMGDCDRSEQLLNRVAGETAFSEVIANERAALAWSRGLIQEAAKIWNDMAENPVTLFNRGVCEWMLGRTGSAAALFDRAADTIPDRSGWSHLAAFYASVCEGE